MRTLNRRRFVSTAALAASAMLTSRVTFAATGTAGARFVFVLLRGGLDGLSAVPPYGDPGYEKLRRELAIGVPRTDVGALDLDGFFGLHPSLPFLHESYAGKELAVAHAAATPYRDRSHFDGQNVLESGFTHPNAGDSGWLNRALAALPGASAAGEQGVALGQNVPLVLRGPARVASWSPSRLAPLDDDTLARIQDLYAGDTRLSKRLADALAANERVAAATDSVAADPMIADAAQPLAGNERVAEAVESLAPARLARGQVNARFAETVQAAAGFLRADDGPTVAVFDITDWDTHANEGAEQGQLALRLAALDSGLRTLKQQLGRSWSRTAVLVATEFGRTVEVNGSRGTDHGTAAAAFLVGGAVNGGRVIADWPGLGARDLYDGRDLAPTLDLRAVLKGVLGDHLGVPAGALDREVFPDSANVRPALALVRS